MKKLLGLITAIAVTTGLSLGSVIAAPAANADTGDFHFTVKASSYDHVTQNTTIKNRKRLLINGHQQLTWENSNHGLKTSAAQIKAAPKIKTACTSSNRRTQSTQIFRKTHGARTVVILPGSCLWNRGMRDQYHVGFEYHVKQRVVLKVDSHHRYRHAFTLKTKSQLQHGDTVVGKVVLGGVTFYIVKSCLNFIGGPVDTYTSSPIQVRYAQDVKYSGDLEVDTNASAHVTFSISCPNGARFDTTVDAAASGSASQSITFTERTRVSVTGSTVSQFNMLDESVTKMHQDATSRASAQITVEGTCGDTPPTTYTAPQVSASASACVEPGQSTGIVTVTATNNNDTTVTGTYTFPGKADQTASFSSNQTIAKQFTGVAPGSYTGTVSFGAPVNLTAQYNVVVQECANNAPSISASAGPCVNSGSTAGVISVSGTNHDTVTRTLVFALTGKTSVEMTVAAGSTETVDFTGLAPGTYTAKVTVKETGKSASQSVTQTECPAVDHAPQISCVFPAHVFVGGNVYLWCESSDSDGDAMSVNIVGDSHAHVSGVIPSDVRWDGTACPVGKVCWRATLWGDNVGTSHIVATVTANGKSATSVGDVPVVADQF